MSLGRSPGQGVACQTVLVNNALRNELNRGFNLSSSVEDRLQLLLVLWNKQQRSEPVLLGQLDSLNLSYVQFRMERLRALDNYGWVQLGPVQSPIDPLRLSPEGCDVAEEVARRRCDRLERRRGARRAVLYWLDQPEAAGAGEVTVARMGSFGRFLAERFTEEEISLATKWLLDRQFVTALTAWGGGIIRPSLSLRGQDMVERQGDPTLGGGSAEQVGVANGGEGMFNHHVVNNFGPATNNYAAGNITGSGTAVLNEGQRDELRTILEQIVRARDELAATAPEDAQELGQIGTQLATHQASDPIQISTIEAGLMRVQKITSSASGAFAGVALLATQVTGLLSHLTV